MDDTPHQPLSQSTTSLGAVVATEVVTQLQAQAEARSLAAQILRDPVLLRRLCDRVYGLMRDDLHRQHERSRNYGGRYG